MPALSYLIVPHPLGGIRPDKVRAKAAESLDAVEAALLGGAAR